LQPALSVSMLDGLPRVALEIATVTTPAMPMGL
jgi:hypothetical protein